MLLYFLTDGETIAAAALLIPDQAITPEGCPFEWVGGFIPKTALRALQNLAKSQRD